ncbi:hypothetical protein Ocin01_05592 [Orchesella cincta]|uniref:PKD/Chitinase domain-containing protein n=1 Tax=Orchesella cincta TaxID=48709 RepID=A0A1D2N7Z2_ORCCI|nr:hypothetical protein Ocin01_05592 [Orchesella cincta]
MQFCQFPFRYIEKRLNHAPVAVISPSDQEIHLPTTSAVLDASLSTDDDKIISYKWELQKGPIEYAFNPTKALNSTTLQVESLTPGNYTFKLTVEDSEHIKNSTTANITVIKETDYPPTANAGKDIVIYLPQTELTLNGNASTDDKKIVEWEWKATGDLNKAVDMQDTHTPYLLLSHLQVGLYQFELKVTDEAGQSTTSTVHVIVKPPTGNPPKANAGIEQTISIPQNWAILDASGSSSDSSKIVKYTWTQTKGPSNTSIVPLADITKANVSGLTKGDYEFQVEVEDDAKLTNKSSVKITVMQRNNEPPKANAGGDVVITLPFSVVKLNGSGSTDDVKITEWQWEREEDSLAAGIMLAPSDTSPVLQLTDLVAGKYVFKLIVKDEQGLSDEDTVTLTVKEDVRKKDLIEIILDVHLYTLSTSDRDKIIQQITLLLHNVKITLSHMRSQLHTENAVLILYGQNEKGDTLNGPQLAAQLRQKIHRDDGLLQFPIVSVDTVLCLDNCSGHGVCQDLPSGRMCLCNAFWMENFLKRRYGNGERNCDWSKIYVGVVTCLLIMMVIALFWSLLFMFQRNFRTLKENINGKMGSPGRESNGKRHAHKKQYTLLDDDEEIELELKDDDDGESDDSDSDILFETKRPNKTKNGFKKISGNGAGPHRNGILKNPRRIKT